ncbi:MAG: FAD:protein FMN transferase [Caldilineaceae bacterium]|nr:FAD:protein FMN transferase [Caldilineaceae bacterium]
MRPSLITHRFRAMNTDVAAWIGSTPPLTETPLRAVESLFVAVESTLSRFSPQSELSRLNAAAGKGPFAASPTLWTALALALDHAETSDGIFDPTLLKPLLQAGYNRSFEQLSAAETGDQRANVPACPDGWRRIHLDAMTRSIILPADLGIDLGGIAKGWAVDQAALALGQWGPALVDAGGDIRITAPLEGEAWPIAIQDPFDPMRDLLILGLKEGAVATSSTGKRRWQRNGRPQHHLIDPRSGKPVESDLHTVTVLAPTAVEAEVAAKVALILGRSAGTRYLQQQHFSALLITNNGKQVYIGQLPMDTQFSVEGMTHGYTG